MYAVVTTGGKQEKVSAGDVVRVEKLDAEVGDTLELDGVQLLVTDDGVVSDANQLQDARVVAEVLDHGKRKKIRVFKYKRRKNYHRTRGHRQQYTELRVREIKPSA